MRQARHAINQPSVTVAGQTGAQNNLGSVQDSGKVIIYITIPSVTGTTPSWTPRLQGSVDGVNWADIASFPAITAAGTYRLVAMDVLDPQVQLAWVAPTGTTPVFTTPTITLVFPII